MILFLPFALMQAAAPAAPLPQTTNMTEQHLRDLHCVAFFGVSASILRRGTTGYNLVDVRTDGPRWAGIVGERVMRDTGLPKEVVGFAINEAVPDAQRIFQLNNPDPMIQKTQAECLPRMRGDLAAADAQNAPLPKPQSKSSK
jgi:hypothetical protein